MSDVHELRRCEECGAEAPASEFVAAKSGRRTPWCLRCRQLWSAERNGVRCDRCGEPFIRRVKRVTLCDVCTAVALEAVAPVGRRPGSLLNPNVDPEAERRWRETRRRWAEIHGAGSCNW